MKKALQTSAKVRMSKDGKKYLVIPFRHGTPGSTESKAMPDDIYNKAEFLKYDPEKGYVHGGYGAKNMRQSFIVKSYKEGSIRGAKNPQDAELLQRSNPKQVMRNAYQWGDRLNPDYPLERSKTVMYRIKNDEGKYKTVKSAPHKTNIYAGMVRMQANPNIVRNTMMNPEAQRIMGKDFNMGKFSGTSTGNMRNYSLYYTFRIMHEDSQGWIHPGIKPMNIVKETKEKIEPYVIETIGKGVEKDFKNFFKTE
jgi:hypothetical protein